MMTNAGELQQVGMVAYSARDRVQYLALICMSALTLCVSRALHPSAGGVGTHEQLGLPPCIFHKLTGIPCPSCGLTTSFAHFVRFEFVASFTTQPFGFVACSLTVLAIPFFAYMIRRRVAWLSLLNSRITSPVLYSGLVLMIAGWIYKIVTSY